MTQTDTKEMKGWHVLIYLLGFFGIMFAVNGVFLYSAIVSFPGEDTPKSYLQGLQYNDTLAQRAAQQALGWQAAIGIMNGELVVMLEDSAGAPLPGYSVDAVLRRAATTSEDIALPLQARGHGKYSAATGELAKGRWEAVITLREVDDGAPVFVAEKTLMIS